MSYIPGVSAIVTFELLRALPIFVSTVTPARLPVRRVLPVSELNNVVLPLLGLPTNAILIVRAHVRAHARVCMCEHVCACILYVAVAVGAALAEPFVATEVATVQTDLFAEQQLHSWQHALARSDVVTEQCGAVCRLRSVDGVTAAVGLLIGGDLLYRYFVGNTFAYANAHFAKQVFRRVGERCRA